MFICNYSNPDNASTSRSFNISDKYNIWAGVDWPGLLLKLCSPSAANQTNSEDLPCWCWWTAQMCQESLPGGPYPTSDIGPQILWVWDHWSGSDWHCRSPDRQCILRCVFGQNTRSRGIFFVGASLLPETNSASNDVLSSDSNSNQLYY